MIDPGLKVGLHGGQKQPFPQSKAQWRSGMATCRHLIPDALSRQKPIQRGAPPDPRQLRLRRPQKWRPRHKHASNASNAHVTFRASVKHPPLITFQAITSNAPKKRCSGPDSGLRMSTTLRTQLLGPHREENTSDPRRRLQRRLRPLLFRIITVFRGKFPVRSPECMLVLSKTPRAGAGLERKYACLPLEKLLDAFEMFVINRPGMISNDSHGRSMHSPLFYRGGFISQFHAGRSNRTSACPHLISQHQGRQGTDLSLNADSPTPLKSFTFYPGLLKPSAPPASH